jgi:hypothetical protein
VTGDASLSHQVSRSERQTTYEVYKELADALSKKLALVGIIEAYLLTRSIDYWGESTINHLPKSIEGLVHKKLCIVEYLLHIDLNGTGSFGLQQAIDLGCGHPDVTTYNEAANTAMCQDATV